MVPLDTRTRAAAVLCGRTRVRGDEGKKLAILTEAGEDTDAMVDRTRTPIATTVAKVGRRKLELACRSELLHLGLLYQGAVCI